MGLRVVEVYEGEVGHEAPVLVRELVRRGVRVQVVCPPRSTDVFGAVGATVTAIAVGTRVGSLSALRRVLRGEGTPDPDGAAESAGPEEPVGPVDVVHAHGLRAAVAVSLARAGATPFVVSLTELPPTGGAAALVGKVITRAVFPAAAVVLAPTQELLDAATGLGAREARLARPPLPQPPALIRSPDQVRDELALPPDGPIVLAQARLQTDTRLDVLVDAAARWRRPYGPQVVLAGVGPAYRDLVARAMVARASVTFAGDRTGATPASADRTALDTQRTDGDERASLDEILAASAVAVVTDVQARPGFALRAARAGVALVLPRGGVVADLLGGGARTVPPGDVDALDQAVRALLDGEAARADLVAAARARVADWPDAAAVAAEIAGLYERVSRPTVAPLGDTPGGLQ